MPATPVTLLPVPETDERTPLGLASNGGVLVPLDRRVALVMRSPRNQDFLIPGMTRYARDLNQAVVLGARRYVSITPTTTHSMEFIFLNPKNPDQIRALE